VGCLSVALKGLTGLGSRTVCRLAPHNKLVQHQMAPARFAADRSIGSARTSLLTPPSHCKCRPMLSLADPSAARSAVPVLFGAEPASGVVRWYRPCAIQARLGLWGRHL